MQFGILSALTVGFSLVAAHETTTGSASATSTPCVRITKTVTQKITLVGCRPGVSGCHPTSPTSSPFSSFSVVNATSHAMPTAHLHTTFVGTGSISAGPHTTPTPTGTVIKATQTAKVTVPPGESAAGLGSRPGPGLLFALLLPALAFLA